MARSKDLETAEGKIRHEAKFHRILDAALDVFVAKGFYHAKISEVARAAGVADGTIYLYFKNKDDLMASVYDIKLDALAEGLRHAIAPLTSSADKLVHIVDYHLDLVQSQGALMSFMRHEVHSAYAPWGARDRAANNAYLREWQHTIAEGIKNQEFAQDLEPEALMQMLYGALDHACNVWASHGKRADDLQRTRDQIRRFILAPIIAKS